MKSFSGLPTHYTTGKNKGTLANQSRGLASSQSRNLLNSNVLGRGVVFKNTQKNSNKHRVSVNQRLSKSIQQLYEYETNSSQANGANHSPSPARKQPRPIPPLNNKQNPSKKRVRIEQPQQHQTPKQNPSIQQQLQQVLELIRIQRAQIQARIQQLQCLGTEGVDAAQNTEEIVLMGGKEEGSAEVQTDGRGEFWGRGAIRHVGRVCEEMRIKPELLISASQQSISIQDMQQQLSSCDTIKCQKLIIRKLVQQISRLQAQSLDS